MPWSATTTSLVDGGQRLAQLLDLGVDHGQLLQPLGRGDAVLVAGPVEVAVVEVGERRAHGRRHDRGGDPLADPVRADVLTAAGGRHGQPAPPELALVDDGDGDAGLLHPRERGGVRLPLERVDVLVPEQRDEQLLGAGDPAREARPARASRASARCPARSGWSPSSTARPPCRSRCRRAARPGTARRAGSAGSGGRRARRRGRRRTTARRAAAGSIGVSPMGRPSAAATAGTTSPRDRLRVRRLDEGLRHGQPRSRVRAGRQLLGEGQQPAHRVGAVGRRRDPQREVVGGQDTPV